MRPHRSWPISSGNMELGAARPPHRPPKGGWGVVGSRGRKSTPAQYRFSFPAILAGLRCLVVGFRGTVSSWTNIWVHFYQQHPWNSMVVLEEGNQPHPWYPQCDMFVPQETLNQAPPTSEMFRRGTERKRQRPVVDETEERTGRVFLAYGTPMTSVSLFRYLGQTLLSSKYNWLLVNGTSGERGGNGDGWQRFWEGR